MEELKLILDLFLKLPDIAIVGIIFYFIYKSFIVGSIYAVIRFVTQKIHDVIVHKKVNPPVPVKYEDITPMLDGMLITGEKEHFLAQLRRIAGKGVNIETKYIHHASVEWLRQAIDDKLAKDELEERTRVQKLACG